MLCDNYKDVFKYPYLINPITQNKIKSNGTLAKRINNMCSDNNYITRCNNFYKIPTINPMTGREIKKCHIIYLFLQKMCTHYSLKSIKPTDILHILRKYIVISKSILHIKYKNYKSVKILILPKEISQKRTLRDDLPMTLLNNVTYYLNVLLWSFFPHFLKYIIPNNNVILLENYLYYNKQSKIYTWQRMKNHKNIINYKNYKIHIVIIRFTIIDGTERHQTLLIYNKNRLYHFDSHGSQGQVAKLDLRDLKLNVLKELSISINATQFIPIQNYCPYISVGGRISNYDVLIDRIGYCSEWNLFYIHHLLLNNIEPIQLQKLLVTGTGTNELLYIRQYYLLLLTLFGKVVLSANKLKDICSLEDILNDENLIQAILSKCLYLDKS